MSEFIKRYKFFTPENYDKEETYLREMSLKGWHFKHLTRFGLYTFEKGEPASYCYRLDFIRDITLEKDYYINMYEDCGWSHIFEFSIPFHTNTVWQYFRIKSQTGCEEVLFSDNESKVDMLKRVRKTYAVVGVIALCLNIFNFFNISHLLAYKSADFFIMVFVLAAIIFVILLWVKILFGLNIKINKLKNEKKPENR